MDAGAVEASPATRLSTVEELQELRDEVVSMARQLQNSARALSARVADADRREAELERRRLDIARRHEEQLLDIETKTRRMVTETQNKLELSTARNRELEQDVKDGLDRLAAVQRDYDILQAAMLRVQNREAAHLEEQGSSTRRLEEVRKVLESTQTENQHLRKRLNEMEASYEEAKRAATHYKQLYRTTMKQHNRLADAVRRESSWRLEQERSELEDASRRQKLTSLQQSSGQGGPDGVPSKGWSYEIGLRQASPTRNRDTAANPLHVELKETVQQLIERLKQDDEEAARLKTRRRKHDVRSHTTHQRRVAAHKRVSEEMQRGGGAPYIPAENNQRNVFVGWVPACRLTESCEVSADSQEDSPQSDTRANELADCTPQKIYERPTMNLFDISDDSNTEPRLSEHNTLREATTVDEDIACTTAERFSSSENANTAHIADTATGPEVPEYVDEYVIDESTEALLEGRLPPGFFDRDST